MGMHPLADYGVAADSAMCLLADNVEKEFTMRTRETINAAVGIVVIGFGCMAASPATKAQVVVASGAACIGQGTQTYAPAISYTPQNTAFHSSGTFFCPSTSLADMTQGSFEVEGNGVYSCLGVTSFIGSLRVDWKDGNGNVIATSQSPLNSLGINVPVGTLLVARDRLASGPFQPDYATVIQAALPTETILGCVLGTGVSSTNAATWIGISSAI